MSAQISYTVTEETEETTNFCMISVEDINTIYANE